MNSKPTFPFLQPLFLLIVITSQFASVQLDCPTNYVKIVDRCYYFSWTEANGPLSSLHYFEARQFCQRSTVGTSIYDLFVISDLEEFALITAEMNIGGLASQGGDVFVGAYNNGTTTNVWYWVNGTTLSVTNTLWNCHSPTVRDHAVLSYDREITDCYTFGEWLLRDVFSSAKLHFICEGPPLSTDTSGQLACSGDYIQLKDRCYYFSLLSEGQLVLAFDSAREVCGLTTFGSYTYDLLIISDFEEYALITAELSHNAFYTAMIGAHNLGASGTPNWYWVDGKNLSLSDSLWQCLYPSTGSNTAAALVYSTVYGPDCYTFGSWRLQDTPKSLTQLFVCEGPAFPENVLKEAESYWKQLEEH